MDAAAAESAGALRAVESVAPARLAALPQPLHLFEFLSGNQHYHFGCHLTPDEPSRIAQDRMSLWGARCFLPGSAVLDVGCGLGGTSRLLAAHGLRVTGLDPEAPLVDYARARSGPRVRFVTGTLEQHAEPHGRDRVRAVDGVLAIEVLQHFPALADFFGPCRRLLRPGGALVLHFVALNVDVPWPRVPFHRAESVLAAARSHGFDLRIEVDLTAAVLPTLPELLGSLRERRTEIVAAFASAGRAVEAEIDELAFQMSLLQEALEGRQLSYRALAFEATDPEISR